MRITCKTKDTLTLDALTEFQGGLKKRDDSDFEKIRKSIEKYGFATPFFVWKRGRVNYVLDGHGRLETLKRMQADGAKIPPLPIVFVDCKSEADAKNLLLRINSTYGRMTAESIADFLGGLQIDFDEIKLPDGVLDLTSIMDGNDTQGDDDAPEPDREEKPKSKVGEVYELGSHRLICGDSTDSETIKKLMNGETADITFTSPPYNAGAKIGDGDIFKSKKSMNMYTMYEDKRTSQDYIDFAKKILNICFENTDGFIFWNCGYNANSRFEYIAQIVEKLPFLIEQIAWKKTSALPIKGSMRRAWEPIYVFSTNKKTLKCKQVESNFWEISNTNSQTEDHKACFPVELPQKGISLIQAKSGIVLDPFGGSGSTLIAAEKCGRIARLAEVDPHYCDVIRRRWTQWAKANGREVGAGGLE